MSEAKKQQFAKEAFERVMKSCQLRGVSYLGLTKNEQDLLFDVFQEGIKFCVDKQNQVLNQV